MFIRLEKDGSGGNTTIECTKYRIEEGEDGSKLIYTNADDYQTPEALLEDSDHYSRAYVMNNEGGTIEIIRAPRPGSK